MTLLFCFVFSSLEQHLYHGTMVNLGSFKPASCAQEEEEELMDEVSLTEGEDIDQDSAYAKHFAVELDDIPVDGKPFWFRSVDLPLGPINIDKCCGTLASTP